MLENVKGSIITLNTVFIHLIVQTLQPAPKIESQNKRKNE